MSINTLTDNPASQSKPWCNLYVETLTAYKGLDLGENGRFGKEYVKELSIRLGDGSSEIVTTTATFRKAGKIVQVNIKPFTYTIPSGQQPTYYITIDSGYIPEECLPKNNTIVQCLVRNDKVNPPHPVTNGKYSPGAVYFGYLGTIGFYCANAKIENDEVIMSAAGDFPVGVTTGIYEINTHYMIN